MKLPRSAGVLLHPTSLPGRYGIGDLGPESYRFAEILAEAGVRVWQVLPLGPTGYGNSPYHTISAFAGNPLLISLESLANEDLLSHADLLEVGELPQEFVDFDGVTRTKLPILRRAYEEFRQKGGSVRWDLFDDFCRKNHHWLEDFALFSALRAAHGGLDWTRWDRSLAAREPDALRTWSQKNEDEVRLRKFLQFIFFRQWERLRRFCARLGLSIMGDVPIFMPHDSADVWAHRDLFELDTGGRPRAVAGVPPDYFSKTGQLWGNPLYDWEVMARNGYAWWIDRLRAAFEVCDLVRLDHFRGFEAYWRIPAGERTAENGEWVKGPGEHFFRAVREALGELPIIAENLGQITPEVESLRKEFRFPGMAVLQFAFGNDPRTSGFIPHNVTRDAVYYTGTHDNDTVRGWWNRSASGDERAQHQIDTELRFAARYLGSNGREIHWDFIRAVFGSVAGLAIVPVQDLLGLGTEARMNLPGTTGNNWRWRLTQGMLTPEVRDRLKDMVYLYGRLVPREDSK